MNSNIFSARTYTRKCKWDNITLPYYPLPLQIEVVRENVSGKQKKYLPSQILKCQPVGMNSNELREQDASNTYIPRSTVTTGHLGYTSPFSEVIGKDHKQESVFIHASMLYYLVPGDNIPRVVCPVPASVRPSNIADIYSSSCAFCYASLIPGVQYYEEFHLNPPVLEERGYGDDVRFTPHSNAIYLTTPSFCVAQISSAVVNDGNYSMEMDDKHHDDIASDIACSNVSAEERDILARNLFGDINKISDSTRPSIDMTDSEISESASSSSESSCEDEQVISSNDGSPLTTAQTKYQRKRHSLLKILSRAARKEILGSYKDELRARREEWQSNSNKKRKKPSKGNVSESSKCRKNNANSKIPTVTAVPSQHCYYDQNTFKGREAPGVGGAGGSIVKDVCTQVCWNDLPVPPVHHFIHYLQRPNNPPK